MVCPQCRQSNPAGVVVCKSCGAKLTIKAPPSMITVNMPIKQNADDDNDDYDRAPVPRGVVAALIAAGLVVVAGLIIVVVLLTGQADTKASAVAPPVQVIEQTPELSPSATPESTPTPIPTTNPDNNGEDYSSLFEPPQDSVLPNQ